MKVLLLGLGRANLPVAKYLMQRDDEVFLYEDSIETLSQSAKELINSGQIQLHQDDNYDLVITSPGVHPEKEIIKNMVAKNISVIDEIEFTYSQLKNPRVIAVTGTNGKSTTISLIGNILNSANFDNFIGGNISPGRPFSQALFLKPLDYYVLEISSFQLMRIKTFHPKIAVLTNITIDHLDWHEDFEEYKIAKSKIFANQDENDFAVLNADDENVFALADKIKANIVFFGRKAKSGVHFDGDFFYGKERLFSVQNPALVGRHSVMNIAAAIVVAKILRISNDKIDQALRNFKSLPHRLEDIGKFHGVRYINNSMCTNESAAIASFLAIEGEKIVIIGGKQKGDAEQRYLNLLIKEAKACIILGSNAQEIATYFKSQKFRRFKIAENVDDAVKKAREFAESGDVILLNPGFASFDYFRNFEERGEAFKNAAYHD